MMKKYAKLIRSFDLPVAYTDYKTSAGIYFYDGSELFLLEITDSHTQKTYSEWFNSEWCPEEMKEWLANVVVNIMTKTIRDAQRYCKAEVKRTFREFLDTIGFNIM